MQTKAETVFFEGTCRHCASAVKFLKQHEEGNFRFAPIDGALFRYVRMARRNQPYNGCLSILTEEGTLLTCSDAWRHILLRLGGNWQLASEVLSLFPDEWVDLAYLLAQRRRS